MCGLFGFALYPDARTSDARRALAMLAHRGPDQSGEWSDGRIYIGHRRLSILDLTESARQPMVAASVVMAANGEIYNYRALRRELQKDYSFTSESDSEVLLHGYREWGMDGLLERIDGMFAFVLYDVAAQRLYLVRDRIGIKPLYYSERGGSIVWGSELKAIRNFIGLGSEDIDRTALYDFLTYRYVPSPKSLYRGVCKLEPARYLEFDLASRRARICQYWKLPVESRDEGRRDAADRIRELISTSVNEQLISDVSLGCFLSGGVDSTTIVAEASKFRPDIRTFCISFPEESHDESAFARLAAARFSTRHETRTFDAADMDALLDRTSGWYDEPFGDLSSWPTYLVSSFAREQIVVALSGDGGDEVFGGYRRYLQWIQLMRRPRWVRSTLRCALASMRRNMGEVWNIRSRLAQRIEARAVDDVELYVCLLGGLLTHEKKKYMARWELPNDYDDYWHLRRYYRQDLPALTRLQYLDFHTYLPDDILTKVDRTSMAVSLETRVPFLSRDLVEYVFSLPESVRFPSGELKGLLKMAYSELIPEVILKRRKKGFSIPSARYLGPFLRPGEFEHELILRRHAGLGALVSS